MSGSGKAPSEYVEYKLIKDLYHCTPSQLDEEDHHKVQLHAWILSKELEFEFLQRKRANQ